MHAACHSCAGVSRHARNHCAWKDETVKYDFCYAAQFVCDKQIDPKGLLIIVVCQVLLQYFDFLFYVLQCIIVIIIYISFLWTIWAPVSADRALVSWLQV